jgi:hypothetical protein
MDYYSTNPKSCVPLKPYQDAYNTGVQFHGVDSLNGNLNEDDALKIATKNSLDTITVDGIALARAIRASLGDSQAITINDDAEKTPPPRAGPVIHVNLLTLPPQNITQSTTRLGTDNDSFLERVENRAFLRSQMTTEVLEPDNPTASPQLVATSPMAFQVYNELNKGKAVAKYVSRFHKVNPLADSQEGYLQANDYLRTLDGKRKKKRSKKQHS